jgi:hypothetical protein
MKIIKRFLVGIVALAVLTVSGAVPVFGANTTDSGTGSITGDVTINGTISPLTVSMLGRDTIGAIQI